jgi:hypothetical protein
MNIAESSIDLGRYPINAPKTDAYEQLVAHCRRQLAAGGACELTGFITADALSRLVDESVLLAKGAYFNAVEGNAYLSATDLSLPEDHPKRMTEPTSLGVIAYDEYPATSILRNIYEWQPLMDFIRDVMELPTMYRYADPMGGLNLSVMKDGDYLRWHFDQTDFVTSIAIQTAEEGGEFEVVPLIRDVQDERYGEVRKVLKGDHPGVITIANKPGTLLLFKGRHSIHRVTEIKGPRPRLMGLLAYDEHSDVVSTDHLRQMRYGRTKPKTESARTESNQ